MAKLIYYNYELDFLGKSIITTDDHGIILETALPFHKYRGRHIDSVVKELSKRTSFHGLKDLGKTINSRVINLGDGK